MEDEERIRDEVPEGDAVEQAQPATRADRDEPPDAEAAEGDALEQARPLLGSDRAERRRDDVPDDEAAERPIEIDPDEERAPG